MKMLDKFDSTLNSKDINNIWYNLSMFGTFLLSILRESQRG